VPPTNNACEREIRPSVVFRKVTGGFRSHWGAQIHAGYRSVTGTARLHDQTALQAISQLSSSEPSSPYQHPKSQQGEQLP
jgi:transposase